jgi:serpin B
MKIDFCGSPFKVWEADLAMEILMKRSLLVLLVAGLSACASKEKMAEAPTSAEATSDIEGEKRTVDRKDAPKEEQKPMMGYENAVRSNNAFAFDLHKVLPQTNLIYSPHSVSTLLAAVHAGARGETEQQIRAGLHIGKESLNYAEYRELAAALKSRENVDDGLGFRLRVTNGMWVLPHYKIEVPFQRTLETEFAMKTEKLDFIKDPEGSRKTINQSISEATAQKIPELLPSGVINNDTRVVLTNAVYFNAPWANAFQKSQTANGEFTLLDQSKSQVSYMNITETFRTMRSDDFQAIEIPYVGDSVVALIILPNAGKYGDVDMSLNQTMLENIQRRMDYKRTHVKLPKFEMRTNLDLVDALEMSGMTAMFDPKKADFTGITVEDPLFVSAVLHEGFIRVDEAGTEAAAATAMVMVAGSAPSQDIQQFYAERPFTFLIIDKPTGEILFISRVVKP